MQQSRSLVLFDIDGTLTSECVDTKKTPIVPVDGEMARQIAVLLKRGTPVVLITGRGSSAREAAAAIRGVTNLSFWQVRRLYCAIHNGVSLSHANKCSNGSHQVKPIASQKIYFLPTYVRCGLHQRLRWRPQAI